MSNARTAIDNDHSNDCHVIQWYDKAIAKFRQVFNRDAEMVAIAPGRVNLIGEHVDYNDGFVLPMAVRRYVFIAAARRNEESQEATIHSVALGDSATISLDRIDEPQSNGWVNYLEGVVSGFRDRDIELPAFDAVILSSIPMGAGLSSSAALEVATSTLFEQLSGHELEPRDKALLCQTAEHRFAGVPCGVMDQFSSVFGRAEELMLIDCRSKQIESVPFDSSNISVLITNSNVKHELSRSEYSVRRSECDAALQKLGQNSWRDVSSELVEQRRDVLNDKELLRARHVVSETARAFEAAQAFRESDWETAGTLMYASHDSLRDNFAVSCPELDALVEIAREAGGVIGSRMTGGGFGGCTVSLVSNDCLDRVIDMFVTQYKSRTGLTASCFATRPAQGTRVLEVCK